MKVGDITKITSGYAFKSALFNDTGEGMPLIRIRDVGKQESNTFYTGEYSEDYVVEKGDLLISMDGEFKIAKWLGEKALLNQRVCKIESSSELVDEQYLLYVLPIKLKKIEDTTSFVTVKHLSVKTIKDIELLLPSINEQRKIVKVLDKAQSLIDKRKEAITKLDELVQAVFWDMFGDGNPDSKLWINQPFSYFAKIDTRMIKDFKDYTDFPHVGIENIQKKTGRIIHYKTVGEENLTSGKYYFSDKHIIYSKIRPYLNKVALPNFEGLCSADSYPLLVNEEHTNRSYFGYVLRSNIFLTHVEGLSTRTNIPKVNKSQLESFNCPAPPIQLQDSFEEVVLMVDKQRLKMEQYLVKLELNFNALLQQAFKGELSIKDEINA